MSLRLRLTIAYALLQVIVVGVLGLVLDASMFRQLETELQNRLDEGRLAQILTNLLDNALRHTPRDGTISIRLERQDGWAHLSVTDTGEGIRPEDLPHIFERFYRGGRSAADRDDGTGLGLAIVKYLTEAHDGRVTAESELGRGSSFAVWLPARR